MGDNRRERLTNVLWLDIGVHEITLVVEILQPQENLLRYHLHKRAGNSLLLVSLDQGEEVLTEGLKYNAYMRGFGALMAKRVEEGDDMGTPRMRWVSRSDLGEQLDLVPGSLGITTGGFHDFQCRVSLGPVKIEIR